MARSLPASLLALALLLGSQARAESPNIILFLVDDLGWMDTAVYGSRYYETPSIDRLAAAGMLFSDAYAASPLCSPTRASILTGKYPARLGITNAVGHHPPLPAGASRFTKEASPRDRWLMPESRRFLAPEEVTIAEVLRERGYRTAHIGKWHLGQLPRHWPDKQGFDVVFQGAPDPGPPSYVSPYGFRRGNIVDGPEGEYITDRLTDEALEFIEASAGGPFFLHLAHFGVHGPWGYKEELRQAFVDRGDPRGRQGNSAMAAMIRSVDQSLGRLVDKLAELELTDHTMILFLSDNGGAMHTRMGPDQMLPTDNAPLRGAKGLLLEGGIRVPLIVSWPGVVEPGSRNDDVVSSIDLFPTVLQAAGAERRVYRRVDGRSLVPLLEGTGGWPRRAVFNYLARSSRRSAPGRPGRRVPVGVTVRQGRWKLVRWLRTTPWFPDELELFDLEANIGETNNLAPVMPRRARRLNALIDDFLADTVDLPLRPNPAFSPRVAALGGWSEHRHEPPWPIFEERRSAELRHGVARLFLEKLPAGWAGVTLPFLEHRAELGQTGPYQLELRARAKRSLEGRVVLSYPRSPWLIDRVEPFDLTGTDGWPEVSMRLAVESTPVDIRLEFRTGLADVEIESIRLRALESSGSWPAFTSRLEWRFELPS